MSVAASTPSDDVEAEALRRAQRAHEPSMEEILASIRAIIADDQEPPAPKPGPQIVYSSDEPIKPVTFGPEPEPEPAPAAGPPFVWARAEEPPPPEPAPEPPAPPAEPPLLSQETQSAVADSFTELAETVSEHAMRVAERTAREMLRPMLKQWLDDNLPAMVERLVRVEIERLARGRR